MTTRFMILYSVLCASLALSVAEERPANNLCAEAMTTAAMRDCLTKHYQTVDRELNHVYQQVMSRLPTTRQTKLRDAQRRWILFRDTHAEFEASAVEGGTMYALVYLSALTSLTETRVNELKTVLQQMNAQ